VIPITDDPLGSWLPTRTGIHQLADIPLAAIVQWSGLAPFEAQRLRTEAIEWLLARTNVRCASWRDALGVFVESTTTP